jgi:hypothetical protein
MKYLAFIVLTCFFASGCASYSLSDGNGNTISGSSMNGAYSISRGPGCVPTYPSDVTAPVTFPAAAPVPVGLSQMCDVSGKNCRPATMYLAATPPVCETTVVNIHGMNPTTLIQDVLVAGVGAFLLSK